MVSFKEVLIDSIKRKSFTREYYEETIAKWTLKGWLDADKGETDECLEALNKAFGETTE